eukprot:gene6368-6435_t
MLCADQFLSKPEIIHAALGDEFYDVVTPARFPKHILRYRNAEWAARVGLDGLNDADWIRYFGMFEPLPGSFAQPLALRYHGHQFQHYNPDLGDGRGFLYAQLRDLEDGRLLDLGTKGSGTTPWSRAGDGRLTLKGGVREILATSMLEALGVNTSKSFSLIETGEELVRGDEPSPTRSAVLVRLSHSHIRIGTFQRLAHFHQKESIERLLNHVVAHYMPELAALPLEARMTGFLQEVSRRLAETVAQWMTAGFVHGVLNSDNINVTGESFDYGPWRFAPIYAPGFTAAYFDQNGLYAFGRQPSAVAWNLTRLAECFVEFLPVDTLSDALDTYADNLQPAFARNVLRRLGLQSLGDADLQLANALFKFLNDTKAGFEQSFFDLYGGTASQSRWQMSPAAPLYASADFVPLLELLQQFRPSERLNLDHAYFQRAKPCTMLIDEVEAIWAPIAEQDDWSVFNAKLANISLMAAAYRS